MPDAPINMAGKDGQVRGRLSGASGTRTMVPTPPSSDTGQGAVGRNTTSADRVLREPRLVDEQLNQGLIQSLPKMYTMGTELSIPPRVPAHPTRQAAFDRRMGDAGSRRDRTQQRRRG
jgi:hypothetical protein